MLEKKLAVALYINSNLNDLSKQLQPNIYITFDRGGKYIIYIHIF